MPQLQEELLAVITSNGHQYVIYKNFIFPGAIGYTIKWSKYKTENEFVFVGIFIYLIDRSSCVIVDNNRLTKDRRAFFSDNYLYQKEEGLY